MGLEAADYPNYGLDEDMREEATPEMLQFEREHWAQLAHDAWLDAEERQDANRFALEK